MYVCINVYILILSYHNICAIYGTFIFIKAKPTLFQPLPGHFCPVFASVKSRVFGVFPGRNPSTNARCRRRAGAGGGGRGRGRKHPATPSEVSPESERKSRTLSPSKTRCPSTSWRGSDSVLDTIFSRRVVARVRRHAGDHPATDLEGTPQSRAQRPTSCRPTCAPPATSKEVTPLGHPFDELQLKKRFCLSKSVTFLAGISWVSLKVPSKPV